GHDRIGVTAGDGAERALHAAERAVQALALGAEPEAQVERHLVVPAAAGVELAADRPDELRETALDRHVDVLVGAKEEEATRVELAPHRLEAARQTRALARRQELRADERLDVGEAAGDVVWPEAAIDGEGRRERLDDPRRRCGEPSGPRLHRTRLRAAACLHFAPRSTSARMRRRSPASRMNPPASSCR